MIRFKRTPAGLRAPELVLMLVLLVAIVAASTPAFATALSDNRDPAYQMGKFRSYLVEDDVHIYDGALVCINASGYLQPAANTANFKFVGVAAEEVDNTLTGHTQGGKSCRAYLTGDIKLTMASVAVGDVGKPVYVTDDQTVAFYATNAVYVGTITQRVSSTVARVHYDTDNTPAPTVLSFYVDLASITAAGDVLTAWTPGFAGVIEKVSWYQMIPVTTATDAATINLEIGTTNVTGGAVSLTSAACTPMGKVIDGTAITAANIFDADDTISIEAASVTAFAEGDGMLLVSIRSHNK